MGECKFSYGFGGRTANEPEKSSNNGCNIRYGITSH